MQFSIKKQGTMNRVQKVAQLTHKHRAWARQNAEGVPGLAGDSFCLDFSCFVLCVKTKNEVGLRGEAPDA